MSDKSSIQWTDATWNPTTGCTKVSPGCAKCYIDRTPPFRIHGRKFVNGHIPLELHENRLEAPLHWKAPRRVFVNSLSDLFHADVPDAYIDQVFAVMAISTKHTFQLLTKRADRMRAYVHGLHGDAGYNRLESAARDLGYSLRFRSIPMVPWPIPNIWLGVSVENQRFADERIPLLLQTPAAVRFISAEPLLGPVDLGLNTATCTCCQRWSSRWVYVHRVVTADFPMALLPEYKGRAVAAGVHRATSNRHGALTVNGIGLRPEDFTALPALDWIIVGGESGPRSRPFDTDAALELVQQCQAAKVPVFVKQLGANPWVRTAKGFHSGVRAWPYNVRYHLRDKKGGDIAEWPDELRVREFPTRAA